MKRRKSRALSDASSDSGMSEISDLDSDSERGCQLVKNIVYGLVAIIGLYSILAVIIAKFTDNDNRSGIKNVDLKYNGMHVHW